MVASSQTAGPYFLNGFPVVEEMYAQVASVFNPLYLIVNLSSITGLSALDKIFPLTPLRKIVLVFLGLSCLCHGRYHPDGRCGEPHVGWQNSCLLLTGAE